MLSAPGPRIENAMTRIALLLLVLIALCTSGCLTRRTIKEGDHVVAEGYVVKPPLAPLSPP
ncbi:MAG: hypothetical protein ABIT76_09125 [Chthoniobacterales bacterium]